ncbi:hypothetical protein Tco_0295663, partial [Tanacetum coccineum]
MVRRSVNRWTQTALVTIEEKREQLTDAGIEIKAYTQGLKKVEAQLVAHQQGQLWYEEKNKLSVVGKKKGNSAVKALTGTKRLIIDAGDSEKEDKSAQDYFVLPIWSSYSSTVKRSTEMDAGEAPNTHPDLKTDENPVEKEDQVFLEELTRLKRQAKDANDVAEALRKEFAQETKDLLLQAGAAKTSSTNIVNTASTPDIYQNPTDGIFTNSSYDDEGAVADFTNLEPVVNVSPIPTSRIHSIHPSTLILGDPQSAVNTRSKVTKIRSSCFYENSMGEITFFLGLQVKQKEDGIFISQDKYVAEILKKFDFVSVKTASTPIETQKPLVKDEEASDVDVHLYRSMICSLMYLTASRPDIMFAVCACSRFQVTPKTSHLSAIKRIFRYLKGKPKLGLWYPRVSSFDLEAYSDSDYVGANLDRKSTIGEAEYNPVYHSKTKHIAIRHHFIRDAYEKKLIQVLKIHTDDNVADLLTKCAEAFLTINEEFQEVNWVFKSHWEEIKTYRYRDVEENTAKVHLRNLSQILSSIQALISLLPTITNETTMAVLESCPKHNMVTYLEKTEGNAEFHEVIDFLARSFIHHALTVSPVVSTTFVEQFWMSVKSKIINNVRYITAKVAGKLVSISEASIRSDLLFDDADGIDSLPNQAIFDAIQLMGHLDAKKKFVMYPRFISIFLDKQLMNVPVPLDHFPVNALTSKVFSFMVKKGKHFSGKVTPLFASMLVQSTEDEGATSERPSDPQPTPSPPHPSEATIEPQSDPSPRPSPTTHIPDSIPEVSGGNQGGQSSSDRSLSGNEGGMTLQSVYDLCISLCTQVTDQAKEIKHLKAQIKKLKKKAKPVITHHRAWMKSVSLKQRLAGKKSLKSNWMQKESVSKQGRKSAKAEPLVHKDPLFYELDDDEIDNMDTEDAQDVGRTKEVVNEEKETVDDEVSTKDVVSTDKEKVSTDRSKVSTDRSKVSTDKEKVSTVSLDEGTDDRTEARSATLITPTTTPTMFGDNETIAQVLLNMSQAKVVSREKEKGVDLKDVEETERPRPTSTRSLLTLKSHPK